MIRKRRVIAAVVVVTCATVAACLGPRLSSTEHEAIVVQQGSQVDLGDVMVGNSGSATITISPASGTMSSSDTITMITENCPAFALVLGTLPATVTRMCLGSGTAVGTSAFSPESADDSTSCTDSTYSFQVTFTPAAQGPASCTVTIAGTTFSPVTVLVKGNGVAPALGIEVTPSQIEFGDIRVGSSGSGSATIRNIGSGSLTVSSITVGNPSVYTLANATTPLTLGAGSSHSVGVTCTPPQGAANSTLNVSSNAGPKSVTLACTGVMTNLNLAPSPTDVTTRVGEQVEKTVTLQNVGSASATINAYSIEASTAPITIVSPPSFPYTLFQGSSATIRVRHAPTTPSSSQSSTQLAKLRVTHDGATIREIPLNGAALDTAMQVFPDTVDFGPVCAGTVETKDVEIKAAAAGSFVLSSTTGPTAPFAFAAKSGTTLPATAMGNQTNTLAFTATVTPMAAASAGPIEATVTLVSDIPNDKMHALSLKANVLPGGVGASPLTMDFGGVMKNTLSQAMSTEVRNCSDAPLVITGVRIEGPNATDFSIVIPGPSEQTPTLQPRESVSYHVVLRSETAGAKVATLVIESATSSTQVALLATALGGGDGEDGKSRSYYTGWCAAGGGGASYALCALGLLFVLRRRRR